MNTKTRRENAKFVVNDRVAFTFPYSARRTGTVIRRWWAGAWCYAVLQDGLPEGEWLLSETVLQKV